MNSAAHSITIKSARHWLAALLVVSACLALMAPGVAVAAPARTPHSEQQLDTSSSTESASRQRAAAELAEGVRSFARAADLAARAPTNTIYRIGFVGNRILLKILIRDVRAVRGLESEIASAERTLKRETRRVEAAWKAADAKAQIAALVRVLESLSTDAARASGARSSSEVNAFTRAHLADVRYASRRWLVDRKVGRQGAVIISRGVRNPRLRNAIEQLYRPNAKVGDGGTADALLAEVKAGCRGTKCSHFLKAGERRAQLLRILSEERLSAAERGISGELVGALTKSIRAAGGR